MLPVIIQVSNKGESIEQRNFREIGGMPVLSFLIDRVKKEYGDQIILATTDCPEDDSLETVAAQSKVQLFRGSWKKCLSRLIGAMSLFPADSYIRIFANSPLVDLQQMKHMAEAHKKGNFEYSYDEHISGVMIGAGCDIFSREFAENLLETGLNPNQEETIGLYIRQNEDRFHIQRFIPSNGGKYHNRISLASEKDLEVIRELVTNVAKITNESIGLYLSKHPVLAKYNLESPSKEVGLDKLFIHPEKVAALLSDNMDNSYPISVELTLTNKCNLRCVYCSDQMLRERQGGGSELSKDVLFQLFDDLAAGGTQGITIEGGGEPTIYPAFDEVVEYAKNAGLAVGLITNGTQHLEENTLRKLEWIRVSLDATTAAEYTDLKGPDFFEKVLSNIEFYARYCETVGVGFVVTNKNISHIEELVIRLRELGASYIQLRPVVDNAELYPEGVDFSYLSVLQTSDFAVIMDGMQENAESGNHGLPCKANSVTNVISGDGSVYLCGRLNIYDWVRPIGNINAQSFREIWLGEERKRQWEKVRSEDFCLKFCPQCRVSKFNVSIDRMKRIKSKHFI